MTVRVRFAPSPTGLLHVGNARAALYNYLYARGRGGAFVLRGDDTDVARSTDEFQQDILDGLEWLGLDWDEGLERGGPHEPYLQSERFDRYREVAAQLVNAGLAYSSFVTPEQLDDFRKQAHEAGRTPAYDGRHRIPPDEAAQRIASGEFAPTRFAVPRPGATTFDDAVRGEVRFDHEGVDDFVILRSDGTPTYHLASSVDDVDFGITHVVRGEDLLSSTPKHILLTRAMGAEPRTYAHLSLLMGPDGRKLSKRHGDTSLRAYRRGGYLPEAVVNYLALLGWSPGEDETVVSMAEMVERFDLTAVTRSSAIFDADKLDWMNGVYIRDLAPEEFVARVLPYVQDGLGRPLSEDEMARIAEIAPHVQERTKLLTEVPDQVSFLLGDVVTDEASWAKVMASVEAPIAVAAARAALEDVTDWQTTEIERALRGMLDEHELSARKGLQPLRVAITGSSVSPPLFESVAALGREASLRRLNEALARLES
ncbi:MAG: glutamate--tRNA ligase [Acidimicrobiia bacterium]